MTAAADPSAPVHPRTQPPTFWRARLGAMASRGETTGPRVDEARDALAWHRHRRLLIREIGATPEQAEELLDLLREHPGTDDEAVGR